MLMQNLHRLRGGILLTLMRGGGVQRVRQLRRLEGDTVKRKCEAANILP